jgi:hypothetical protein
MPPWLSACTGAPTWWSFFAREGKLSFPLSTPGPAPGAPGPGAPDASCLFGKRALREQTAAPEPLPL